MAEGVVEALEAVEIDQQQGGEMPFAGGEPDRLPEAVDDQHAVREAGQRVVAREIGETLFTAPTVGDVRGDEEDRSLAAIDHRGRARLDPSLDAVRAHDPDLRRRHRSTRGVDPVPAGAHPLAILGVHELEDRPADQLLR